MGEIFGSLFNTEFLSADEGVQGAFVKKLLHKFIIHGICERVYDAVSNS